MPWSDKYLDQKRLETDLLADDLISQVVQQQGKTEIYALFKKLISNIELPIDDFPGTIRHFLESTAELPAWLSIEDLKNSNLFFVDHGPKMLLLLYFKSLPLLYSDAKGAQVLVRTGRLTHQEDSQAIFTRRIAETGQFLLNVMSNDNFMSGGLAINSIRKVRLIHAFIRLFMKKGWDINSLGQPINQEDMAYTLMTFSISLIDGLKQLNLDLDEKQMYAYFERWRAIGQLLGVADDMIPQSIDEGRLLTQRVIERQSAESDEGKLLTKALIEFAKYGIPGKIFDIAPEALITYFVGASLGKKIGISDAFGCLGFGIPAILASTFRIVEKLEKKSDRIEHISNKISKRLVIGMVRYFDKHSERHFQIPTEFQKAWDL